MESLKRFLVGLLAAVILAGGCATTYRPVVDPLTVTDSETLERDLADCHAIARSVADDAGSEAAKSGASSAAKGAALGAVLGAIAGAITGRPGTGAAVGAATGGAAGIISGATTGSTSAQWQFENAYDSCMLERGYELLRNHPPGIPPSNPQ